MSDRYSNLDAYLPPTPAERPNEPDPDAAEIAPRRRRLRLRRVGRGLVGLLVAGLAASAVGAAAARVAVRGTSTVEARFNPAAVVPKERHEPRHAARLSLRDLLSEPDRIDARRRPAKQRTPRRHTRRAALTSASVAAVPDAPSAPRPSKPERRRSSGDRANAPAKEEKQAPALPAPPGTPLFDCYSAKNNDHYTTNDRASAAQIETSKGGYTCTILGYVYSYAAPGTRAIVLDYGTAHIFATRSAKTEPSCDKVALYRHSTGHDEWYSRTIADPGPVGYIKP
ncbi:MAG TPA: hypothetical protein VNP73_05020 [Actinomycetota bacterium]|nr:hypothetical protein [Actinomycetota bacterium]